MRTLGTLAEAAAFRSAAPSPVVLVPTMGALHDGHAALIEAARTRAGRSGTVIVSIFVNPTQFGPNEDLSKYPRPFEADLALCEAHGADAVFAPTADEMYPTGDSTFVDETELSRGLCGAQRPGHFRGVCTVVAKLFNIIRPAAAIFGEKDYQQLATIRRMARDLALPIEIVGGPLVRDSDGLALSSRNVYLSPEDRRRALSLSRALRHLGERIGEGERDASALLAAGRAQLEVDRLDYLELRDPLSLRPLARIDGPARAFVAAVVGRTRLIDNLAVGPTRPEEPRG